MSLFCKESISFHICADASPEHQHSPRLCQWKRWRAELHTKPQSVPLYFPKRAWTAHWEAVKPQRNINGGAKDSAVLILAGWHCISIKHVLCWLWPLIVRFSGPPLHATGVWGGGDGDLQNLSRVLEPPCCWTLQRESLLYIHISFTLWQPALWCSTSQTALSSCAFQGASHSQLHAPLTN